MSAGSPPSTCCADAGTRRGRSSTASTSWNSMAPTCAGQGHTAAGLIDQEYGVCAGRDGGGDLHQVQVHRLGVAGRQDQGCTLTLFRSDGCRRCRWKRCAGRGAHLGACHASPNGG